MSPCSSKAQMWTIHEVSEEDPRKVIQELKEGTLIIRLDGEKSAIDHLKKTKRLKEAAIRKAEVDSVNMQIIDAFQTYYTFSQIRFTYGYLLNDENKDKPESIFLDNNAQVQVEIEIDHSKPQYFLRLAHRKDLYRTFYVVDSDFKDVSGIPHESTIGWRPFFRKENRYPISVDRFDRKLHSYWAKYQDKMKKKK